MTYIVYGANGYTGRLIAHEAARRGHDFIVAGRNRAAIEHLGRELGRESRLFSLDDESATRNGLAGATAVLHCAGPFIHTSRRMVDACLAVQCHYLDITGEIPVFESIMCRAAEAKSRNVTLIPGVGFDVVPTDCLGAMLASMLPDATELELAFHAPGARISRGTFRTVVQALAEGGAVRRNGEIIRVPIDYAVREVTFSCGPRTTMSLPWGDVSSAFHTTGIPDITVYAGRSPKEIRRVRAAKRLFPLLALDVVRKMASLAGNLMNGPDEEARHTERVFVWGRVSNANGEIAELRLSTVEAYEFTVRSALAAVERAEQGTLAPGAFTPALAFGSDFVLTIPGTTLDRG